MSTFSRVLLGVCALALLHPAFVKSQTINPLVSFGPIAVGSSIAATVSAPVGATFSIPSGSEFSLGTPSCTASGCSVSVTFQPVYPGVRKGSVWITNNGVPLSKTPLLGIGTAPLLSLGPGLITTVTSATNGQLANATITGVLAADPGQVYVADSRNHQIFATDRRTGEVTLTAGTGTAGYSGDGGPATSATLNQPSGLSLDFVGDLLICDTNNHVIRKVDRRTGLISTVAGSGLHGYSGDGGPATSARLDSPAAVAVDLNGNIIIADTNNSRIRQVSIATGVITTIAGNGAPGFGGDGGAATSAQLNFPVGLTVDASNNLYVADLLNNVIREVSSGTITTVAGQGGVPGHSGNGGPATSATLSFPYGVAVDAAGDLYISESQNNWIRKVTGDASHTISTFAGSTAAGYIGDDGAAFSALLHGPTYMSFDNQGNLLFVDSGNNAIRSVSAAPAPVTFPLTSVGSPSTSTVIVSNIGNTTLNVSSFSFSANFSGAGGTCGSTTTLLSGQSCTSVLSFLPTTGGPTSGTITLTSNTLNAGSSTLPVFLSQSNGLYFVPVAPCRVVDTRNPGTFAAGALAPSEIRHLAIRNSTNCPSTIPSSADVQAYALNVTVVPPAGPGHVLDFLTVAPSISSRPGFSTLNSRDGRTKANAAIVPANLTSSDRSVDVFSTDNTDLILDVFGYYVPQTSASALAYYPLPPCRVADTRSGNGGIMATAESRPFPIWGVCSVPNTAQAFALNLTALPPGSTPGTGASVPLPFLTAWPTGQAQPVVSTLNATTGAVTANAAIIPAGASGNISVYVQSTTHLIIDVSGYYAPAGPGGLALYNINPCRAYDSRTVNSGAPISSAFSTDVRTPCSLPPAAQSVVLNATVVPTTSLLYLTLWAHGSAQPLQSTLNAFDGAVTSNLAVVPTADGLIFSFGPAPTALIYDVFGYFAP